MESGQPRRSASIPGAVIARNLTVVIPTLNAVRSLPATLAALGSVAEVIVVDGGSTDATPALAAAHSVRVLTAPAGRGGQLAVGIAAATQPWLLLLHADTILSASWRQDISLAPHQAGYFRFALDSPRSAARRLERLVAWRCRILALPYGDQGLLIHRELLGRVGGMKTVPLMEDVDLVRRLGRRQLASLPAVALTASEKWERDGYLRRSARNLTCLFLWFIGLPPDRIRRLYQ